MTRLSRLRDFGVQADPKVLTWSQRVAEQIEAAFADQQTQLDAITALQTQQAAQLAQILAAQAAATTAQSTAVSAYREAARINSYTNPGVVLGASDAGASATITIADHMRVYPVEGTVDVPDVAITGGSLTGLAYSTEYYVYYDDTTLANGTPTFIATTDAATAQVGAAAGRHCCSFITTPASGAGGTSGGGTGVPGGTGGGGGGTGGYLP